MQRQSQKSNSEKLSIIIPAYKQAKTIQQDVKNIESCIIQLNIPYEIIIVVDGMKDDTYKNAKKLSTTTIKVIGLELNHGKGYAVRTGMLKADGDIIGFIDAGMDIGPTAISLLINYMNWYDADIIIGSKLHPESKVVYPVFRKILSWGYRSLTHVLFDLSVKDTQVGLKFFKKSVVRKVFPRLVINTFAFDIEILAVARYLGFKKIYEGPIELNFSGASTITSSSFWRVIIIMLIDTFKVLYRLKIVHLYDRKPDQALLKFTNDLK